VYNTRAIVVPDGISKPAAPAASSAVRAGWVPGGGGSRTTSPSAITVSVGTGEGDDGPALAREELDTFAHPDKMKRIKGNMNPQRILRRMSVISLFLLSLFSLSTAVVGGVRPRGEEREVQIAIKLFPAW
jgi:hypothetical protein